MKNMLHLSLALMLIAFITGAFNFARMYKTGEIEKIYATQDETPQAALIHKVAVQLPETPAEPSTSPAGSDGTDDQQKTDAAVINHPNATVDPADIAPGGGGVRADTNSYAAATGVSDPVHITSKLRVTKKLPKLSYKSFSRARMPDEEEVIELDPETPFDSTTVK
jgi:hypothetical protein